MFHCQICFRIFSVGILGKCHEHPLSNSRCPRINKRPSYPLQSARLGLRFHFLRNQEMGRNGVGPKPYDVQICLVPESKMPQKRWNSHHFPHWDGDFRGPSPILQACMFNVGLWRSCTPKCWLFCTIKAQHLERIVVVLSNKTGTPQINLVPWRHLPETRGWCGIYTYDWDQNDWTSTNSTLVGFWAPQFAIAQQRTKALLDKMVVIFTPKKNLKKNNGNILHHKVW